MLAVHWEDWQPESLIITRPKFPYGRPLVPNPGRRAKRRQGTSCDNTTAARPISAARRQQPLYHLTFHSDLFGEPQLPSGVFL